MYIYYIYIYINYYHTILPEGLLGSGNDAQAPRRWAPARPAAWRPPPRASPGYGRAGGQQPKGPEPAREVYARKYKNIYIYILYTHRYKCIYIHTYTIGYVYVCIYIYTRAICCIWKASAFARGESRGCSEGVVWCQGVGMTNTVGQSW